jgi:GT2 family glycosyltransferase
LFKHTQYIIVNCNSPDYDKEEKIIKSFSKKHKNIRVINLEEDPGVYGAWNIGIKEADTEYVCNSNTDDLRFPNSTEEMVCVLNDSESALVYGDSRVMTEYGIVTHQRSEHSLKDYSRENMIKCLPGAIPVWRKSVHLKYGYFDDKYSSAADWEFWLRIVNGGESFLKLKKDVGAYYFNPNGISTNEKHAKARFAEEKEIFFKYEEVFGDNYEAYKGYFSQ